MSLFGAINIGMTAMTAFEDGLQTISYNVANISTNGFKERTTTFQSVLFPSPGNDSHQYGGVKLGPSQYNFSEGNLSQTTGALDLAVQGAGFLVTTDPSGALVYQRTGSFSVDAEGHVVDSTSGNRLSLLGSNGKTVVADLSNALQSQPSATTSVSFTGNISSTAQTASISSVNVYDSLGASQTWSITFAPATGQPATGSANWTVTVTDASGSTIGSGTIGFIGGSIDTSQAKVTVTTTPTGAAPLSVTLDFSQNVTSYSAGNTSTIATNVIDGFGLGSLSGESITSAGELKLSYTNGQTKVLGSVAIAAFADPQKLSQNKAGYFTNTSNQKVSYFSSGNGPGGTLLSQQIEGSNVNLSAEFGDLILIQRGFQAASQIISVSDDMIQNLFGIKGHN